MTFFLTKGEQLPPANDSHLARGQVILDCEIHDYDVWKEVLEKINGLRIYTVSDLAEAMVSISQKKHVELQDEFHKYKIQMNTQLETLKAANSRLQAQANAFQEANEKWAAWAKTVSPGKIEP